MVNPHGMLPLTGDGPVENPVSAYVPPALPVDEDSDDDAGPPATLYAESTSYTPSSPGSQGYAAGHATRIPLNDSQVPLGRAPNFGKQHPGAYIPPTIHLDDGELSDSSVDEPPASLRYEMHPLNERQDSRGISGMDRRYNRGSAFGAGIGSRRARAMFQDAVGNLSSSIHAVTTTIDSKEKAARWFTQEMGRNKDKFLQKMYQFFNGKGFYCIILTKLTNLLTSAFVVAFSTFLFGCVDYSLVHEKKMLAEIIKPQCLRSMHWIPFIILLMFSTYWTFEVLLFALKIPQLSQMYQFIYHGLGIDDTLMQTISWRDITVRLNMLSVERGISLDAHAIANRIMRKDNYMVALFNKDILDLRIPRIGRRQMLTSYMELNIQICIFWCVFDHKTGMVRKEFLREANRPAFARELRKKFFQVGVAQLILIPFLVPFRILYFFFQYAEEYHQNPSALGSRQYSPLAWWKFREFNELEHIFRGRLNRSYNHAIRYMNQFPNYKLSVVARFTAFITGSFLAVLVIFSMVSEELLHGFEITPDRSAFFYIGIFGTIMAVSRGMVPDENQVFEPARLLRRVAEETHYLPTDWRGKLHLEEVRYQFSSLFDYKIMLFVYEIMSVLYAPFILLFSLPKCADSIVDFFREFTVHVNSLGYVCSFAVFDFKRHGNANYGAPGQARDDHYISKEGKMEQSFLNFKMHNPDWEPGVEGSQYLNTVITRGQDVLDSQYMHDPGDSSVLFQSMLRPRRNVKFDEDGMHDIHRPALADAGPSRPTGIPQTLHPMHAVGSQIFHPGRGGSSLMPPRPAGLHPYMAGADSAQLSDTGEGNGMGRALFAVLDAIYESNRASY